MNEKLERTASELRDIKVNMHKDICDYMTDIYRRKNEDYGDSFGLLREEYPNAILVRIGDKYNRLKTLHNRKENKVTDESICDTLLDLANYCIMELIETQIAANEVIK